MAERKELSALANGNLVTVVDALVDKYEDQKFNPRCFVSSTRLISAFLASEEVKSLYNAMLGFSEKDMYHRGRGAGIVFESLASFAYPHILYYESGGKKIVIPKEAALGVMRDILIERMCLDGALQNQIDFLSLTRYTPDGLVVINNQAVEAIEYSCINNPHRFPHYYAEKVGKLNSAKRKFPEFIGENARCVLVVREDSLTGRSRRSRIADLVRLPIALNDLQDLTEIICFAYQPYEGTARLVDSNPNLKRYFDRQERNRSKAVIPRLATI